VINKLYAQLLANGHQDKPGGLKPRTVRYIHTTLHRAFKDAVRWGRLPRNPVAAADPPGTTAAAPPEMGTWTAGTLARFLELSAPGLGASTSPSRRSRANRSRHFDTVVGCTPNSAPTILFVAPAAHANTIRQRNANAWDDEWRRAHRSRSCRSAHERTRRVPSLLEHRERPDSESLTCAEVGVDLHLSRASATSRPRLVR
jgi:hypothetical protein